MPVKCIRAFLNFVIIACCFNAAAQVIDPASSFRNINQKSYFRFHYDNDYFTKTDYYYSQGITLEYVHPALGKLPVTKLLVKLPGSNTRYGLAFNLFGYTPTSIKSNVILYGDRPYASAISLTMFSMAADNNTRRRLSSALHVGIIGPAALGEEIQTNIHRWLKNKLPQGWQYQVRNDIILNYEVNFEKTLLATGDHFLLNTAAAAQLGTLNDRLSGGFNFMAGHFDDPFRSFTIHQKKIQYYLYGQVKANVVGYDATMQGGLFNRKSPYTISARDISRLTLQADGGIVVNFKKLYLSYSQSFLTKEFNTGRYHRWGGISFGASL